MDRQFGSFVLNISFKILEVADSHKTIINNIEKSYITFIQLFLIIMRKL